MSEPASESMSMSELASESMSQSLSEALTEPWGTVAGQGDGSRRSRRGGTDTAGGVGRQSEVLR